MLKILGQWVIMHVFVAHLIGATYDLFTGIERGVIALNPKLRMSLFAGAGLLIGAFAMWLFLSLGQGWGREYPSGVPPLPSASSAPLSCAIAVAQCIQNNDFAALSKWIHPQKEVLFTPFSTVEKDKNLSFSAEEIVGFASDKTSFLWGITAGEGAPIQMTPLEYFRRYVGDQDYTRATQAAVNSVIKTGNHVENVADVFPNGVFVDLYIAQVDPKWEGMDWRSLKIVFEEYEGQLKVVAFVHSEWSA